ncbi:cytoskeleton protein RodZ [Pseudoalteromonas citrea]|uniref:Cytoskeleton protein RodZ n=2 Tax=Pseudoalteromonas citrea TaxID=43655 RepID=A0AAD4AGX0_9GAMM|nr:RodZ domain-containing protein [Pseudoalteromonas citrea]KAF7768801.1 cytoskeleton protein RodZ [Pseudoalteromonas citrea]
MNQESIETEEITPSLGRALLVAREAAEITVEEVAERLKLSPQQIRQLEQDDYNKLGPQTFVRGYLKSYCAVLGLPVEDTLALFKTPEVQVTAKHMQSFSRRTEKEASDNRLMIISYVILVIILGAPGIWWWQSSNTISTPEVSQTALVSATTKPAIVATEDTQPMAEEAVATQPVDLAQTSNVTVDTLATSEQASQPIVTELASVASEAETTTGLSTIVMRFSDDSWVEIFDATQERVAFGVKKSGYTMTVQGQAPFSVVLNKHLMVEVELDGKIIDLTALPKNRLAKFKLPLAE